MGTEIYKTKKIPFFAILFFFALLGQAQVGIGTTEPDASSMMEVESDSGGILIPRLSTAQRLAIAAPANSLLVYDLDERLYYYYDLPSSTWIPINSGLSETRNNYKLVKSEADLAAELAAGGGASYLLTSNTLYEINGLINLQAPIDLNNAYVIGLDANEDILLNSAGSIFTGDAGGSIKTLTLSAPNDAVFDLSGGTGQTIVFRDAIVANSASVGSISGYKLVFFNVINYVNNGLGMLYNDISQLLLANQAWSSSNGGVYETFSGTFDLIQKSGGFSNVTTATAAIDPTGVIDINGAAVIENTVFYGDGQYVIPDSPYENYNFTNNWFVESPGIPVEKDGAATGYYYMSDNTLATVITDIDIPVKINGITTATNLFRTGTGSANNRLVYQGSKTRNFEVMVTGTVDPVANNPIHIYQIYKNGVAVPSITSERRFYSNDLGNFTLTGVLSLSSGDYIEVFVKSSNLTDPIITKMNVVLK